MDLRSGHPYWLVKNGLLNSYPSLRRDESCDVAVIGGGITGALTAYHLTREGVATVLLDKRDVGTGSTAARTALLQYAADHELVDLAARVSEAGAVRSYRLGLDAVSKLEKLVHQLGDDCGFERRKSLYLASAHSHVTKLRQEYDLRRRHRFDVEFLDETAIRARFPFGARSAILASGDAQVDGYRLSGIHNWRGDDAHAALKQFAPRGLRF